MLAPDCPDWPSVSEAPVWFSMGVDLKIMHIQIVQQVQIETVSPLPFEKAMMDIMFLCFDSLIVRQSLEPQSCVYRDGFLPSILSHSLWSCCMGQLSHCWLWVFAFCCRAATENACFRVSMISSTCENKTTALSFL